MTSDSKRLAKMEARAVRLLGERRKRLEQFAPGSKEREYTQLLIRACEALLREIDATWAAMSEMLVFPTPMALRPPDPLECATVAAMMLWPDDAEMRDRWVRANRIRLWAPKLGVMSEPILREFAETLVSPERLDDLREAADKRVCDGALKGSEVLEAVRLGHFTPEDASLGRIRERLAAASTAAGHRISKENLAKNTSRVARFRPVAHLWAAFCNALAIEEKQRARAGALALDRVDFPCRTEDLPEFLREAEAFRWKAENTAPSKRSAERVMRKGEAVRLPPEVLAALPRMETLRVAL